MKIAILADFPLTALSGGALGRGGGQGSTWLPQLALSFAEMPDFEIHWIILDRKNRQSETIEAHGQFFHRISGVPFSIDIALRYHPARLAIRRKLKALRPDVVHAWGTERIYPAALQDFDGPTILSMQGVLTEYARIGGLPDDWRWRRMIASEPKFMLSATIITSESQWGIDKVKAVHPQAECRMVEYGVHPSFNDLEWRPDPQQPYALFVGGADKRKGFDLLVQALKELPDRNWEMRLAGDSSMTAACEVAGLQNVRCLGLLSWPEMRQQLQGAWCAVLPTRGDTSPNTVKEARVVGLPVVTSRHGGQAGYIIDQVNGRVVDPLNPQNLAAALQDVMSSHQRALTLGHNRHVEDRAYLDPKRTAIGFAEIYREFQSKPA